MMENSRIKHSSSELLCGIDGGGTTTKVVVCNLEGQMRSFVSNRNDQSLWRRHPKSKGEFCSHSSQASCKMWLFAGNHFHW